jgi:selenide,water dikinase
MVGLSAPDDAAVWRLDDTRALTVTLDFFTPVVDDPYDFGAIAAANALSDLYAMGAKPFLALNVAAMPASLPSEVIATILRGGAETVREAGAVLAGGHSVQDDEPKYGLVAVGIAAPDRLMTKALAQPGEVLVLSKPLGTGVTTTALKRGTAIEVDVRRATEWMRRLNAGAAELASQHSVRAATDVTGFSLLGHAVEVADASSVRLEFSLASIPFLAGARRYAEQGNFPGGSADNRLFFADRVRFAADIGELVQMMLFDAQTSGGLLLSVPETEISALMASARSRNMPVWPIGRVTEGQGVAVGVESLELADPSVELAEIEYIRG